jgi:hypothetical protein
MRTSHLFFMFGLAACASDGSGKSDPVVEPEDSGSSSTPDTGTVPDTGEDIDALYAPDRVLNVSIELEPDDWFELRWESRNLLEILSGDCFAEPFGSPYTWFAGTVTIDGEELAPTDVRKKGFIGSLSSERPSLKLDFVEFDDDLNFEGAERMTLNNAVSDESIIRQCIGYSLFDDAGLPAPRCNFATVEVNGEDLGVYVHLEPVKPAFLERAFGDGGGDLYEGTLTDFTGERVGTLEPKSNDESEDLSRVDALLAALDADDDTLLAELDAVLDLDAFFTFWAMEVLVLHRDGYASNTNNFYIYADPTDGNRFHFIPWGVDDILRDNWRDFGSPYDSVFSTGHLARRLYEHPEGQALYLARLDELLATVWDEDELDARVDRMASVVRPHVAAADERSFERGVSGVRRALLERREVIAEAREDGPERIGPAEEALTCAEEQGLFTASFATEWATGSFANVLEEGSLELVLSLEDESFAFEQAGAIAYADSGASVVVLEARVPEGTRYTLYFEIWEGEMEPSSKAMDLMQNVGYLLVSDDSAGIEYAFIGYLGGDLVLEEADDSRGAPIEGSIEGGVYTWE